MNLFLNEVRRGWAVIPDVQEFGKLATLRNPKLSRKSHGDDR